MYYDQIFWIRNEMVFGGYGKCKSINPACVIRKTFFMGFLHTTRLRVKVYAWGSWSNNIIIKINGKEYGKWCPPADLSSRYSGEKLSISAPRVDANCEKYGLLEPNCLL